MITGNPVRESISKSNVSREEGIKYFGLDPKKENGFIDWGKFRREKILMKQLISILMNSLKMICS